MGAFSKFKTDETVAPTEDRVGGGQFDAVPSGIYDAVIKVAYLGKASSSKSESITIVADLNGKEYKEEIWISNRDGENYYVDKEDKKTKRYLPGFVTVDELCLLGTGHPLEEQDSAEKVVKIYNYTEKKEINTPVETIAALQGARVKLAILRNIVDKQKKDDSGNYRNTGETRMENTIDKVLHAETGRTVNEYRQDIKTPDFMTAWSERNTGKDRNRSKGVEGAGAGSAGTGRPSAAGAGASQAKKSLFGG